MKTNNKSADNNSKKCEKSTIFNEGDSCDLISYEGRPSMQVHKFWVL